MDGSFLRSARSGHSRYERLAEIRRYLFFGLSASKLSRNAYRESIGKTGKFRGENARNPSRLVRPPWTAPIAISWCGRLAGYAGKITPGFSAPKLSRNAYRESIGKTGKLRDENPADRSRRAARPA